MAICDYCGEEEGTKKITNPNIIPLKIIESVKFLLGDSSCGRDGSILSFCSFL